MKIRTVLGNGISIIGSIILGLFLVFILKLLEHLNVIPEVYDEAITVLIAIFITYLVTKFFGNILYTYALQKFDEKNAKNFRTTFQIIFFTIIAGIIIFTIGTNVTVGLISAGFASIILGIAAQSVLSNFFAGFYLIFAKPFNIGERVTINNSQFSSFSSTYPHEFQIPDFTGTVEEIGFLYTKLINDENVLITIPNSTIIGSMVYNYSKFDKRVVKVRFDLPGTVNLDSFKKRFLDTFNDMNIKILDIKILDLFVDHYNLAVLTEVSNLKMDDVKDKILTHVTNLTKNN
ncbi:MAG: mechanosensitive ion channel family protein [Thermoplasmata archaeon]|nr:mechanosensitive ion channel [Thermoplasmata archaeon]